MKRILLALVMGATLSSLAGCITMHNIVVIEEDGSGTATLELGLTETVAQAIADMQALDPDAQQADIPDLDKIDKDRLEKAIAPYGVKLTAFELDNTDGRDGLKLGFAFQDLKGLSAAMAVALETEPEEGMGIFDAGDGNLVLRQTTYDFSDMPPPPPPRGDKPPREMHEETPAMTEEEAQQKQMEIMGVLMQAMAELDVRMTITVPGDIVETNAPAQEGRTSIWTINSENMMSQQGDLDPVITFSGKGLKIKPLTE